MNLESQPEHVVDAQTVAIAEKWILHKCGALTLICLVLEQV